MGEPAGIGPELLLRVAARSDVCGRAKLILVGNRAVFARYARRLQLPLPRTIHPTGKKFAFRPGAPSLATGREAIRALDAAAALVLRGQADALVTAPMAKAAFRRSKHRASSHTDYLAHLTGARRAMMLFVKQRDPAVALHTVHLPLREALRLVTKRRLVESLLFLAREYPRLFGRAPRIAVAGLNPHAGEGGLLGAEEERTVAPAVREACARGVRAEGPVAPDTVFLQAKAQKFDVVFALYHDQGLIAAKAHGLFRYVNLTLGLPFVRTSPDHGVAYELAGTGRADDRGMRAAALLAARLARRRVSSGGRPERN